MAFNLQKISTPEYSVEHKLLRGRFSGCMLASDSCVSLTDVRNIVFTCALNIILNDKTLVCNAYLHTVCRSGGCITRTVSGLSPRVT
jgi:hypothetical protein